MLCFVALAGGAGIGGLACGTSVAVPHKASWKHGVQVERPGLHIAYGFMYKAVLPAAVRGSSRSPQRSALRQADRSARA